MPRLHHTLKTTLLHLINYKIVLQRNIRKLNSLVDVT